MTTRYFEVWKYNGEILGREIEDVSPSGIISGYDQSFSLRREKTHIFFVSNDLSVSLPDVKRLAVSIASGSAVELNVSFDYWNKPEYVYPQWQKKGRL